MGVSPGEIVDARKMGFSPGENDVCYSAVARKTGVPRARLLDVMLDCIDY